MKEVCVGCMGVNEVRHEGTAPSRAEVVVDTGQIGVLEACEQVRLALEGFDGLGQFLLTQTTLAHLLDSYQTAAEVQVLGLIDGREAAPTNLRKDTVALFEELVLQEQAGQVARTGRTGL